MLAEQFPVFDFAKDADQWLHLLKTSGVSEQFPVSKRLSVQFSERKVTAVCFRRLLSSGGLCFGEDGNFYIMLNHFNSAKEDAKALGAALARTFLFNLSKHPPSYIVSKRKISKFTDTIEQFGEEFSVQWLSINGIEAIEEYCRRERVWRLKDSVI